MERRVPLLMKLTADRLLKLAAAREISRERPGREVRVYAAPSGRTVVQLDRDDVEGPGEPIAAYRCGRLVAPETGGVR